MMSILAGGGNCAIAFGEGIWDFRPMAMFGQADGCGNAIRGRPPCPWRRRP